MKAEIITIGDEILNGTTVDTNSAWIADLFTNNGIAVKQISSVADNKSHVIKALTEASSRVDLIIITGGIGPTSDDITKPTLCEYFNTRLVENKDVLDNIRNVFSGRNILISERNRKQAEVPESCQIIQNSIGTAPCMWFEKSGKVYISLPGVPFEMKAIMEQSVLSRIKEHFETSSIFNKTILIQGLPESVLADKISVWENDLPEYVKVAFLPSPGIIKLRLIVEGKQINEIEPVIGKAIKDLKLIIPDSIYGYDNQSLEEVVGGILKERFLTLSTAESCTGGFIAHKITSVPGSSGYYKGSVIAYSNEIKEDFLGVKPTSLLNFGAVSQAVVEEMAKGVRLKFGTDYSIATSGIAGPGGGTDEKPVGTTWLAVSCKNETLSIKYNFGNNRERNIIKATLTALNMLRNAILKSTF